MVDLFSNTEQMQTSELCLALLISAFAVKNQHWELPRLENTE